MKKKGKGKMSIENWNYKYHNKEIIDIRKELTKDQLEIIKKLMRVKNGINLLKKIIYL